MSRCLNAVKTQHNESRNEIISDGKADRVSLPGLLFPEVLQIFPDGAGHLPGKAGIVFPVVERPDPVLKAPFTRSIRKHCPDFRVIQGVIGVFLNERADCRRKG